MNDRARVTIPDLMFYAIAVAALGGLYPVYMTLVERGNFGGNLHLMLVTLGPAFALVLITTLLAKAAVGPR
jgi:hypothetical protein